MQLAVGILGFGNVGRALGELILSKQEALRDEFGIQIRVVGISTGRHGRAIDPTGINLRTALDAVKYGSSLDGLNTVGDIEDTWDFLKKCPADLIFESIPTNPEDGQPALAYTHNLLERGIHVVSANKGPVAFGYRELSRIAEENGVGFFFESSVMDGGPVLGVGRESLPGLTINRIRGIFNSTTNYIITRMESEGLDFDTALDAAQKIGIAETDPTLDIDGWDSAIKTVIVANVIMGADIRPSDVNREGIRGLALQRVQDALAEGQHIRLICDAVRGEDGQVTASVTPTLVPAGDAFAGVLGTTSIIEYETDVLPRLTLIEHDPGPHTTAYGMLADMINIMRDRHIIRPMDTD